MASKRSEVYQIVTDRMMEALAAGVVPWRQPWGAGSETPLRSNGSGYRGFNRMLLAVCRNMKGYKSRVWLTFNQARAFGGCVRKGEKSTPVVFFQFLKKTETRADGTSKEKSVPLLRYYAVFNLSQCDGVKLPEAVNAKDNEDMKPIGEPSERCKAIIAGYKDAPSVRHGAGGAYYKPSEDIVNMPPLESFDSPEAYFGVIAHEFAHSTGHESRLNRRNILDAYHHDRNIRSSEELLAEMTSAFLCSFAGVEEKTFSGNVSYCQSWLSHLKNDPGMLIKAASGAEKAAEFILGTNNNADETEE